MGNVVAVMAIVVAMFVYPWSDFSWDANSISSLGAVGPPYLNGHVVLFPEILDYGLMVAGILLAMFSLGLFFGRNGDVKEIKSTVGSLVFFVSSIGVFGVGLFSLPHDIPHGISALVAFVGIAVALFFFFRQSKILPTLAGLSGAVSLVGIVLFAVVDFVPGVKYGLAAPEMVIVFPAIFWVIPVSIAMIKDKIGTSDKI
ncbi:DUF998 domain-containing protein [Candidatus Nitrosopumilus sp. bin_68KS]